MDDKVIPGTLALADLEQIVRDIAPRDPAAAGRLGTRLLDQAETLPPAASRRPRAPPPRRAQTGAPALAHLLSLPVRSAEQRVSF